MSKSVDERVVSMQFDNKQFENNVKTSMGTLEKLKQSLKLTEASKGLENVSSAAKKFDISPMGSGVEAVKMKFSALEVMAVTALANITNSAMNAGKHLISAFTIDPIKSGFQEYETQINAVQTILANTSSKGTTLDQVNEALDTLNTYADKTIYNFTEMTRNIGTFTAAGVDLDTSVNAIQGIANLAAVSGSTSQQASTAMYQLSQALAAGTVKLMDWNSVVNAGMGGEVFQNALKKTSKLLGTGAEAAIEAEGSFRESLKTGWLTSEVLTETLKKFTTSGANEYVAKYCDISTEAVQSALDTAKAQYGEAEAIDKAAQALADKTGKNKDEIKSALEMAKTSEDAATKVKTFSQLMDTLKEAMQSGWTQSWEIFIGDFEEAKKLFTKISDVVGGAIQKFSDSRNRILEGVMGSPLASFVNKISNFSDAAKKATDSTKELGDVVDKVINGEFGTGQERFDKLTEAGYNWAEVQNGVNEKLGSSFRHVVELTDAQKKQTGQIEKLTDAELKKNGLTDEEIKLYRKLEEQSKKTGKSISELISEDNKSMTGRELIIGSLENIGKGLITIFKSIGQAWKDIFGTSDEEKIQKIYGGLQSLYNATSKFADILKENGKEAKKIKDTFKGLFAALDLVRMVVGGGLSIAFKILKAVLSYFNLDILDLTSMIGRAIVKFRDWVKSHDLLTKAVKTVLPYIEKAAKAIATWVKNSETLQKAKDTIVSFVTDTKEKIKEWINSFKEVDNIPKFIFDGLKKGITEGIPSLFSKAIEIGKAIYEAVKEFLEINSPSRKFIELGQYVILGIIEGIKKLLSLLSETAKEIGSTLTETFEGFDWSTLFAGLMAGGMMTTLFKLASALESITSPLEGLGEVFKGTGKILDKSAGGIKKILKSTSKAIKAFSFNMKTKGLINIAIALGILVVALAALTYLDPKKLKNAVKIIIELSIILAILSVAISKLSDSSVSIGEGGVEIKSVVPALLGIAASLLALSLVIKIIGSMNPEQLKQGILGLIIAVETIAVLLGVYGLLVKGKAAQNIDKFGKMMVKLSISLLLMAVVVRILGGMDGTELAIGILSVLAFAGIITILMSMSALAGKNVDKIGKMILSISAAMMLMAVVVRILGGMDLITLIKGTVCIEVFATIINSLILVASLAGNKMPKIAALMLSISAAMISMAVVVRILGGMDLITLIKGTVCIEVFATIIKSLILTIALVGNNAPKIAATMLSISIAIGILAGISLVLGMLNPKLVWKGIGAVTALAIIVRMLVHSTKDSKQAEETIKAIAICIGVLAVVIIALSLLKPEKMWSAVAAMSILLSIFAIIVNQAGNIKESSSIIKQIAICIGLIGAVIFVLAKMPIKSVLVSAAALSLVLLSISAAMYILSKTGDISSKTLIALGAITAVVIGLSLLLSVIKNVDNSAATGVLILASTLALLAISLKVMEGTLSGAAALIVGVAALAILVPILKQLEGIKFATVGEGLLILALALGMLAIALTVMGSNVLGVASLVVTAAALQILIPALKGLEGLKFSTVGEGLLVLAAALTILTIAGVALYATGAVIGLLGLGAAVALLGAGAMTAGAGVLMFANGLNVLAGLGSTAIDSICHIILKMAGLIPSICLEILNGITAIIVGIAQKAPLIAASVVTIVSNILIALSVLIPQFIELVKTIALKILEALSEVVPTYIEFMTNTAIQILEALTEVIPVFIEFVFTLITTFLDTLSANLPMIIQAGYDMLLAILGGIRDNIGEIVNTVGDIIIEFLNALGEKLPEVIQAGVDFIFNLIEGLGQGIEDNAEKLRETMTSFCNHLWNAFCEFFGINSSSDTDSNSTKMEEGGTNLIEGLKKGISNMVGGAVSKIKELGGKLVSGIGSKAGEFTKKGKEFINKLKSGMSEKITDIKNKAKEVGSKAISGFKEKLEDFKNAGKDLIDGFKQGIADKASEIAEKAKGVAEDAIQAAKNVLGIKSPSRVFAEIGRYTDEGFVVGLNKYASKVSDASKEVGQGAIDGISDAISNVGDIANSDMDFQPTITPVVDMDSVQAGNLQLGANISSLVMEPVNSVSRLISDAQTEINASNNRVIEAIRGLREDLNTLYTTDDKELALYIDSRKMASALVNPMNRQLNVVAIREGGL